VEIVVPVAALRPASAASLQCRTARLRHRQASGHRSTLSTEHDRLSDRTPLARMLPRVIGGPAWDRGRVLVPGEDIRASSATASSGRCALLRTRCRTRAKDDRRLALERAKRNRRRFIATVTLDCAAKHVGLKCKGCGWCVCFRQLRTCRQPGCAAVDHKPAARLPCAHRAHRCSLLRKLAIREHLAAGPTRTERARLCVAGGHSYLC
jgi:hypothetical protein